ALERGDPLTRREPAHAGRAPGARATPARDRVGEANVAPGAPLDAERREPGGAAERGQRVERGVRRGVVRLPRRRQNPGGGREEDEEVERRRAGQLVEVPGAAELRGEDALEALPSLPAHEPIVED